MKIFYFRNQFSFLLFFLFSVNFLYRSRGKICNYFNKIFFFKIFPFFFYRRKIYIFFSKKKYFFITSYTWYGFATFLLRVRCSTDSFIRIFNTFFHKNSFLFFFFFCSIYRNCKVMKWKYIPLVSTTV
jgi:hypothetical protein